MISLTSFIPHLADVFRTIAFKVLWDLTRPDILNPTSKCTIVAVEVDIASRDCAAVVGHKHHRVSFPDFLKFVEAACPGAGYNSLVCLTDPGPTMSANSLHYRSD